MCAKVKYRCFVVRCRRRLQSFFVCLIGIIFRWYPVSVKQNNCKRWGGDKNYFFLLLLGVCIVTLVTYINFLAYSTPARDIFDEIVSSPQEYYKKIVNDTVVLFRSECLLENVIELSSVKNSNLLITRDDAPWEFVDFLNSTKVFPRKIIITEDTSFFLFYQKPQPSKSVRKAFEAEQNKRVMAARTFDEYLETLEFVRGAKKEKFAERRAKIKSLLEAEPDFLRDVISEEADRIFKFFLPVRKLARHNIGLINFWYYYIGSAFHGNSWLVKAFSAHNNAFPFRSGLYFVYEHFLDQSAFQNSPVSDGFNEKSCLEHSFIESAPDLGVIDNLPAVVSLLKAQRAGTDIRVVILPSNPNYEKLCAPCYAPFYKRIELICKRYGWRFADLRWIKHPRLSSYALFRDQLHIWNKKNRVVFRILNNLILRDSEP